MNVKTSFFFAALAVAWVMAVQPGFTQSANTESEANPGPSINVLPPAYDEQMMRLSEILGALHYLRELCGANEGQKWRDEMKNLIEKEEPTAERRALMIARFNRGFRGFQETYRECTQAAIEANNRYIQQGIKLSAEIPARYGR